jgi:hypothetical protein
MKDASIDSGGDSAPARKDDGCEVCGLLECECPPPLGQCCACDRLIYAGDRIFTDPEGDHLCADCFPQRAA